MLRYGPKKPEIRPISGHWRGYNPFNPAETEGWSQFNLQSGRDSKTTGGAVLPQKFKLGLARGPFRTSLLAP
jgi:hypothetical protein